MFLKEQTIHYISQLPLCYSSIPDNFKAFYLAFNVNSDPNWGNKAYRDSFAKSNMGNTGFSYYARTIGILDMMTLILILHYQKIVEV